MGWQHWLISISTQLAFDFLAHALNLFYCLVRSNPPMIRLDEKELWVFRLCFAESNVTMIPLRQRLFLLESLSRCS